MRLAYLSLASMAALALAQSPAVCFASDGSDGSGGGGAPAPDAAAAPKPEAGKPETEKKSKKAKDLKAAFVVWAAPGHHQFAPGAMVKTDVDTAESLRGAGHARIATDAEVAEHEKHGRPIQELG